MRLKEIENYIRGQLNQKVSVKVKGMRNKRHSYEGIIISVYPNLFILKTEQESKSISYADIITGEVKVLPL